MNDDDDKGGAPPGGAPLGRYQGPSSASPYPLSRLAPRHDLVDVAREIQQADAMLGAVTGGKLEMLARQIRALQEQARAVLDAAHRDSELHRAACGFRKRPGGIYHLYRRPDGALYFSMLSPEDWGGASPHPFEGSFRLEADMSWTPLEEIDARDTADAAQIARLLGTSRG
jgi:hypothetical protein